MIISYNSSRISTVEMLKTQLTTEFIITTNPVDNPVDNFVDLVPIAVDK